MLSNLKKDNGVFVKTADENQSRYSNYLKAAAVFTITTGGYWIARTTNLLPEWLNPWPKEGSKVLTLNGPGTLVSTDGNPVSDDSTTLSRLFSLKQALQIQNFPVGFKELPLSEVAPRNLSISRSIERRLLSIGSGVEFQINTFTDYILTFPSVAVLNNGGFVVAWQCNYQNGGNSGIYGQCFDGNGNKVGAEFQINTYTNYTQDFPSVAALSNGGFVVTYSSGEQVGGGAVGIYGQLYAANANPVGTEFQINTYIGAQQPKNPSVAALNNGGFVVAYGAINIYGQRYDANGNKVSTEFQINTDTNDDGVPSVAALSNGGFVVIWHYQTQPNQYNVYGQRYDANGNKVGAEFQISTDTYPNQSPSIAAFSNGGFVVTWTGQSGGSFGYIYGQRYDVNGIQIGTNFQINTDNFGVTPYVAVFRNGGFVVTWGEFRQSENGDIYELYGQQYDANGNKVGAEFQISNQGYPFSAAAFSNGGFVVTWRGQPGTTNSDIYGKIFDANCIPTCSTNSTLSVTQSAIIGGAVGASVLGLLGFGLYWRKKRRNQLDLNEAGDLSTITRQGQNQNVRVTNSVNTSVQEVVPINRRISNGKEEIEIIEISNYATPTEFIPTSSRIRNKKNKGECISDSRAERKAWENEYRMPQIGGVRSEDLKRQKKEARAALHNNPNPLLLWEHSRRISNNNLVQANNQERARIVSNRHLIISESDADKKKPILINPPLILENIDNLSAEQKKELAGVDLIQKKALAGDAEQQNALGYFFRTGAGPAKDNPQKDFYAAAWFQKAALQGHESSQALLAYQYKDGEGVPQSDEYAFYWFQQAAALNGELGGPQYQLGLMYLNGKVVAQNYDEAFYWFQQAAAKGYADAEYSLSCMHAEGKGVPQSDKQAFQWCLMAAEHGCQKAKTTVTLMYAEGKGVTKNISKAFEWNGKMDMQDINAILDQSKTLEKIGEIIKQDKKKKSRIK